MKISYDPQVDALYIRFSAGPVEVTTHRLTDDVAMNCGPDGRVVGFEVLDASAYVSRPGERPTVVVENMHTEAA